MKDARYEEDCLELSVRIADMQQVYSLYMEISRYISWYMIMLLK